MKTVMLLCGLLCDDAVWEAQARALRRDVDVRVIKFVEQDSMQAMAEHVLRHAPERFALAGHSMGGRVALEVMRRVGPRVERLALLDTGFEPAAAEEAGRRAVLVNRALEEGIDAIAADWGIPMLAPRHRKEPGLVLPVLEMVGRMSGAIYHAQTRALLGRPDASDVLRALDCPTLILCGEDDGWSPPERHRRMAELAPHAVLRLIPDCGHMSMMEQPAAVLDALREWLAMPARLSHPEASHDHA
jgi:pimeloyl-ACP methyl ester carboxylesterase